MHSGKPKEIRNLGFCKVSKRKKPAYLFFKHKPEDISYNCVPLWLGIKDLKPHTASQEKMEGLIKEVASRNINDETDYICYKA